MTYLQILNTIKDTALAQPNVNSVVREFLDLNREDAKYSAVVIQDRDGSRDRIVEQDYITYTWHIGYVDRLTYDESNRDDIISTGINIINNIVNTIRNTWFPELEVSLSDRINTFDQRFTAQCAGVYGVLSVNALVSDCVDSESTDIYDKFKVDITENGDYHFVPTGRPVDEINITVDVAGSGKEEVSLTDTVTLNGTHTYIPAENTVYKDVELTVDVHPTERLVQTYTTNGVKTITGEFNGGEINIDVHPSNKLVETITSNGSYSYPGEYAGAEITVNVNQSETGFTQQDVTEGNIVIINLDNNASFVASGVFEESTIQTVNLPYATTVGNSAFRNCNSLTQVSLPKCSYIGSYAFFGCNSLSQVDIPMCVSINYLAFAYCSLSQVSLPVCKNIGGATFQHCSSLTQVSLPVCKNIGGDTFRNCISLSKVDLPVCNYIGDSAFYNCYSLTQVSLPVCSYIGRSAFYDCSSLTQVSLPMCSRIDDMCFGFCESLSIITIGYSSVCSLDGSDVFVETQITSSTGSIYVPTSLVSDYKSAQYWSYFKSRIFPIA